VPVQATKFALYLYSLTNPFLFEYPVRQYFYIYRPDTATSMLASACLVS